MLRGYRSILIALAGLILGSPAQSQPAEKDQAQVGTRVAIQEEGTGRAVAKPLESQPPDRGCQKGEEDRQSSLCAEWKAADAAAQSVHWSVLGIYASFATALFTFAALGVGALAAMFAKRVIDGSERPYLRVSIVGTNFRDFEAPQGFVAVQYKIDNIGGSPATIDLLAVTLLFEQSTGAPNRWDKYLGGSNIFVLDKGESTPMNIQCEDLPAEGVKGAHEAGKHLVFRVNFSYVDLYKRRRNLYFKTFYAFGMGVFHTNSPPRVTEVPYERYRWRRRKQKAKLWWLKLRIRIGLVREAPPPE